METKQLFVMLLGVLIIFLSIYSYSMSQSVIDFNKDIYAEAGINLPSSIEKYFDQAPLLELMFFLIIGVAIIFLGASVK